MAFIGRIMLITVLLVAPWPYGSVTSEMQWAVCLSLIGLLVWHLMEACFVRPERAFHVPTAVLAPVGLLVVATIQLLPRDEPLVSRMDHAVFADLTEAFFGDGPASGSVAPMATRSQISLLFFAISAFFLGARWFATDVSRTWLLRLLALNGAALGFFGIVQKLTWNGLLFWSVPLRQGGTPFASFVNRNNAAGYLNLCLAAGLGWLIATLGAQMEDRWRQVESPAARRLPWKARMLRSIATVDGRELGLAALLIVIASAVLFSLSRGGILAMFLGVLFGLWWQRGLSRAKVVLALAVFGAATTGILFWVGGWDPVQQRLGSLSDPAEAAEGRLTHWWDTTGAVLDFPVLGTGFGTYRYANLPYQTHNGDAWYVNADNHYLEILVETGAIGLSLYLFGFLMTGAAAVYLARCDRVELRAMGGLGLFLVTTQAVQAFTDFGLLIPANALTFAVLTGSVCGTACRAANYERLFAPWWLGLARLEGRWSQILLALALALPCIPFGLELFAATQSMALRNDFVAVDPDFPLETPPENLQAMIQNADAVIDLQPDDPELHRSMALWWINLYRLEAVRELAETADPSAELDEASLWQAASLRVLSSRAFALMEQGDWDQLDRLRNLPVVHDHLIPARDHLLAASQHGPLTRDVHRLLADLSFLSFADDIEQWADETAADLARAIFVAPSSADELYVIGTMARAAGFPELSDLAYARCLSISDEHLMDVWTLISEDRPVDELLQRVIPPRLETLVNLAEQTSDQVVKISLANHARQLLNGAKLEDVDDPSHLLRARLAELQGSTDEAVQHYKLALSHPEAEIEARFRLAQLLLEEGRLEEADEQLSRLQRMARYRQDVTSRLKQLKTKWLDALPEGSVLDDGDAQ